MRYTYSLVIFFSHNLFFLFFFQTMHLRAATPKLWHSNFLMVGVILHYRWDAIAILCSNPFRTWWKKPKIFSARAIIQVFERESQSFGYNKKAAIHQVKDISDKIESNSELQWILSWQTLQWVFEEKRITGLFLMVKRREGEIIITTY